jgi:hypothetical protein
VMVRTRIIPIIRDGHVLLSCRFSQNIFLGVKFYDFSLELDKILLSLYDHEKKSIQWHTSYHRTRTELRYSLEMWRSRILIAREILKWLSLMPNTQISSVLGPPGMFITDLFMVQETDGQSSNQAAPKHKNSQQKFLVWVAFVRPNSGKINETEKLSCPLKNCEESPFETRDSLLDHIYTCPRLAKGFYKCCDCGNFERISKIHTKGCHELPRVSRVANSFRRAGRRLLPSHSVKNHNGGKSATKIQATAKPMAELATPESHWDGSSNFSDDSISLAELDNASISEIHGHELLAEFDACNNYPPYGEVLAQHSCSELSAGQDSVHDSNSQLGSTHGPIELSTGGISAWMIAEHGRQERFLPSRISAGGASDRTHGYYQSQVQADNQHDLLQDRLQHVVHCYTSNGHTSFPELQSPPALSSISEFDYSSQLSLSNASRTDTDVSAISFGSFSTSWNSSISIVSTLDSQAGHCEVSPLRFFEGGETDMMFLEPESLEESMEPVELPTSSNEYSPTYFGDRSKLTISELESIGESIEPAELPTAFNTNFLGYLDTASYLFQDRVELPTSSNASFPSSVSPSPNQRSFHLPQSFSKPAGSPGIGARRHPICSPWSAETLSDPSSSTPSAPRNPSSKYKCPCGFEPSGKEVYKASNLKRHKTTRNCRRFFRNKRPETTKSFPCPYPRCSKKFTRSDNLRVHQKQKSHFLEIDLSYIGAPRWQPEVDASHEMHEGYRYQEIRTYDDGGNVWN